jgi:hypothetical protein
VALDLTDPNTRDLMGLPQIGDDRLLDSPFYLVAGVAEKEKRAGASLVDFLSWTSEKTLQRYQAAEDDVKTARAVLGEAKADDDRADTLAALATLFAAEKQLGSALALAIKSGAARIAASAEARAIHQSVMDSPELRKAWNAWVEFLASRADVHADFKLHCALKGVDVQTAFDEHTRT